MNYNIQIDELNNSYINQQKLANNKKIKILNGYLLINLKKKVIIMIRMVIMKKERLKWMKN